MPSGNRYNFNPTEHQFEYISSDSFEVRSTSINLSTDHIIKALYTGRGKLNTVNTDKMETNSIETWFVEAALEQFGTSGVGNSFSDGGFPAVRQSVLEHYSDRVEIENGGLDDWVRAFNNVTIDLPHSARAYIAAYQYRFTDIDNDVYTDKLREFAEANGVMEYEAMQTEIDHFYGDNPFNNDDLSYDEAKAACILRANGEDESIIDEVDDAENFLNWFIEVGSCDAALRASRFDSTIPHEIAPELAPPEEWDDLSPDVIPHESCVSCGNDLYEVYHHEDGRTWVDQYGNSEGVRDIGPDSPLHHQEHQSGIICSECYSHWDDTADKVTGFDGEHVYCCKTGDHMHEDLGADDDSLFTSTDLLTPEHLDLFSNISHSAPSTYFCLSPSLNLMSSSGEQRDAIQHVADNMESFFDSGLVFAIKRNTFSNESWRFAIPKDNPQAARQAKEVLEQADEIVA